MTPVIEKLQTHLSAFELYSLFYDKPLSFFLDSTSCDKFSFIGTEPFLTIRSKLNQLILTTQAEQKIISGNPFELIKTLLKSYSLSNTTSFPFIGGAVGFFSYELRHHTEYLNHQAVDDLSLPDMHISFYDTVLIIDHASKKTHLATLPFPTIDPAERTKRKNDILYTIKSNKIINKVLLNAPYFNNTPVLTSNFTLETYCQMVEKAKQYIEQGDIYQVNLSQRFSTLINKHPLEIFAALREKNPSPFSAYMNCGDFQIACSSPERFLKIENSSIETKPIKGTFPRGNTTSQDQKNKDLLKKSMKDHAENYMIVDLLRNDLGKVCRFGSVTISSLCSVESFATVHHLVTTIKGILRSDVDTIDCLIACFPGGSITGAPKIRSMQIIDELEPTARGIYTGSLGYIGFDRSTDLNIAIRTIIIKNEKAYYHVGGGIIWDSIPEKEYQETLDKGKALYSILEGESI